MTASKADASRNMFKSAKKRSSLDPTISTQPSVWLTSNCRSVSWFMFGEWWSIVGEEGKTSSRRVRWASDSRSRSRNPAITRSRATVARSASTHAAAAAASSASCGPISWKRRCGQRNQRSRPTGQTTTTKRSSWENAKNTEGKETLPTTVPALPGAHVLQQSQGAEMRWGVTRTMPVMRNRGVLHHTTPLGDP